MTRKSCTVGMRNAILRNHLNLPCISPQNSVTCNGEYRRPLIKAQPSFHHVEVDVVYVEYLNKWCDLFYAQTYRLTHRSRQIHSNRWRICNKHISRNGSLRKLKIAKESNDLADLAKARLTRIIPEIKWLLSEQKMWTECCYRRQKNIFWLRQGA